MLIVLSTVGWIGVGIMKFGRDFAVFFSGFTLSFLVIVGGAVFLRSRRAAREPDEIMWQYYNHVSLHELVLETRALLKFCAEHRPGDSAIVPIVEISKSLEAGNFEAAAARFHVLPSGKDCWTDWFPTSSYEREEREYLDVVFKALAERWHRLKSTATRGTV
jgi:hypothetical protein